MLLKHFDSLLNNWQIIQEITRTNETKKHLKPTSVIIKQSFKNKQNSGQIIKKGLSFLIHDLLEYFLSRLMDFGNFFSLTLSWWIRKFRAEQTAVLIGKIRNRR